MPRILRAVIEVFVTRNPTHHYTRETSQVWPQALGMPSLISLLHASRHPDPKPPTQGNIFFFFFGGGGGGT